jgi:hypothetical protein
MVNLCQRLRVFRFAAAGVVGAFSVVGLGGCGGHGSTTTAVVDRPLTEGQAVQLSSTLYRNYTEGGAQIDAQVPYSATVSVGVVGDVDFADHTGHLTILTATKGDASTTQEVDYSASAVYEAQPAPSLPGGVGWTVRTPDPTDRPLDRIIQLIVALAARQRDNPLLIAQSQARYTGQRSFDRTTVNVFRYSPSIIYWVGASNGLLYRFIGVVQGISGPVTIDLTRWGPHPTPPPPASEIVTG